MIELSAPVRRVVAIGLLVLALLLAGTLVVAPLVSATVRAIDRLADARFALARLNTLARDGATLPVDLRAREQTVDALLLTAVSEQDAQIALQTAIRAAARATGITLERLTAQPTTADGPVRRLSVDVVATAPERSVLSMIQGVEQARPPMFFARWQATAAEAPDRPMRLEATIVAFWTSDRTPG